MRLEGYILLSFAKTSHLYWIGCLNNIVEIDLTGQIRCNGQSLTSKRTYWLRAMQESRVSPTVWLSVADTNYSRQLRLIYALPSNCNLKTTRGNFFFVFPGYATHKPAFATRTVSKQLQSIAPNHAEGRLSIGIPEPVNMPYMHTTCVHLPIPPSIPYMALMYARVRTVHTLASKATAKAYVVVIARSPATKHGSAVCHSIPQSLTAVNHTSMSYSSTEIELHVSD
ncbi:hypothetical protein BGZ63DRAFT_467127 [Mariannaea sp. PMI_226]|nr:hypothetical protein BGZ63DRAFT_467127 [Mariannaea sp. PMI_226]